MKKHFNSIQSPCFFRAIGIMSGTSLDGLDICLSEYNFDGTKWSFSIIKSDTIKYNSEFRNKLKNSVQLSGRDLMALDASYGIWIGNEVKRFLKDVTVRIDIIGSHGHTVFHEPVRGFSTQIGNGAHIATITDIACVCNFRTSDVAHGGEGAPLVPIGDELLFGDFDFCLNIGGIANVSFKENGNRVAFDICPANMILNHLANCVGKEFDENGEIGRTGKTDDKLLYSLENLSHYTKKGAKSLGREWFETEFLPRIEKSSISISDKAYTIYEHISNQIASVIPNGKVLVTGGGAKNKLLVELIKRKCSAEITIPEVDLIDFKEALVFGLLAILYQQGIPSCLSTVTGANADSFGGCLYK